MIQPHQIPTTGRKPLFLVRQLGYDSVAGFANSLPVNAVVADVGAGLSTLGFEVSRLRNDVRWINIDPCYSDPDTTCWLPKVKPINLELLVVNITEDSGISELKTKVDLVITYWLLPHLSLENDGIAQRAIKNMYTMLKPEGRIAVGPIRKHGLLSVFRYRGYAIYGRSESEDMVTNDILKKTKLWWLPRSVQRFSNRHNIHIGLRFVGGK